MDSLADFKKEEAANFDEIEKGLEQVRKRYRGNGYIHVTAKAERSVNDKDHVVDLTVKLEPGPQFTYGKVRAARWDRFGRPAVLPKYGLSGFPVVWWWDAEKAAKTGSRQ